MNEYTNGVIEYMNGVYAYMNCAYDYVNGVYNMLLYYIYVYVNGVHNTRLGMSVLVHSNRKVLSNMNESCHI